MKKKVEEVLGNLEVLDEKFSLKCMLTKGEVSWKLGISVCLCVTSY